MLFLGLFPLVVSVSNPFYCSSLFPLADAVPEALGVTREAPVAGDVLQEAEEVPGAYLICLVPGSIQAFLVHVVVVGQGRLGVGGCGTGGKC